MHVYVTNRPASGVPYPAGPILTSILSTSSALYHSAVANSENLICALAEKSIIITADLCFIFPLQNSVKGTFITSNGDEMKAGQKGQINVTLQLCLDANMELQKTISVAKIWEMFNVALTAEEVH